VYEDAYIGLIAAGVRPHSVRVCVACVYEDAYIDLIAAAVRPHSSLE
jgi:hypothetical protein